MVTMSSETSAASGTVFCHAHACMRMLHQSQCAVQCALCQRRDLGTWAHLRNQLLVPPKIVFAVVAFD